MHRKVNFHTCVIFNLKRNGPEMALKYNGREQTVSVTKQETNTLNGFNRFKSQQCLLEE